MVGQMLTTSYFRPGTVLKDDGEISDKPFNDGKEEWVLVDGTPASCVQLGLHHLFKDRGRVDLVLSGPNYGRNTTAIFALSSGTIGGAMEGAMNGYKSIALSYAFDSREHDLEMVSQSSKLSTRLIEKFVAEWPEDVHLYSINVPVRADVSTAKIVYTDMLQNQWTGSSFEEISEGEGDADPKQEEQKIRDRSDSWSEGKGEMTRPVIEKNRIRFKWAPNFADVRASVEKSGKGDGYAVIQGHVSVTPLKANFWHVEKYKGEIKL
jgi:tubulin---tyrosine ligase